MMNTTFHGFQQRRASRCLAMIVGKNLDREVFHVIARVTGCSLQSYLKCPYHSLSIFKEPLNHYSKFIIKTTYAC